MAARVSPVGVRDGSADGPGAVARSRRRRRGRSRSNAPTTRPPEPTPPTRPTRPVPPPTPLAHAGAGHVAAPIPRPPISPRLRRRRSRPPATEVNDPLGDGDAGVEWSPPAPPTRSTQRRGQTRAREHPARSVQRAQPRDARAPAGNRGCARVRGRPSHRPHRLRALPAAIAVIAPFPLGPSSGPDPRGGSGGRLRRRGHGGVAVQ